MARWTLDKKFSASLIVTIILQTATAVWWAAKIDSSDTTQTIRIATLEGEMKATRDENSRQTTAIVERLARVEAVLQTQTSLLSDIWQKKAR
jgi:hypothetical protein